MRSTHLSSARSRRFRDIAEIEQASLWLLLLLCLMLATAASCTSLSMPVDLSAVAEEQQQSGDDDLWGDAAAARAARIADAIPQSLRGEKWTAREPRGATPDALTYRWQLPELAECAALMAADSTLAPLWLESGDAVVEGNAAILLARSGDPSVVLDLEQTIRDTRLKVPQRCAAVEALAHLDEPVSLPVLDQLTEELRDVEAEGYEPRLHAELLRGLARCVVASDDPRFAEALAHRTADVRLEAVRAFAGGEGELPATLIQLRSDRDPRIRAATLRTLAAQRHPQSVDWSVAALGDLHLDVRLAAIDALGTMGGGEAHAALARVVARDSETVRAAAVMALAAAGDDVAVFAAAQDQARRVRSAAQALSRVPTGRGQEVARQLLVDRSGEVRATVIESMASWPLEQAADVLLSAMADAPAPTRKLASEQLARRWPPAVRYEADAPAEIRAQQIAELRQTWAMAPATIRR